ncbi:MAG: molecular chaperone Hsp90 [Ruminococcus sp.]|nr:molecular chaperone Hsp90 [Ruminococcus sp.]
MKQDVKEFVIRKLDEMASVPYCCEEARAAAADWKKALGTDEEVMQTEKLLAELEEDLLSIDEYIAFASSEDGIQEFGKEEAKKEAARAKERKAAGAKYCDCPACSAVLAVLEKRDELM